MTTSFSTRDFTLQHIEDMVSSMVKRKQTDQLRKFDFACVYVGSDYCEHAYYPKLEVLIDFHLEKNPDGPNEEYLAYLRSDALKAKREEWAKSPGIEIPNRKND